MEKILVIEDNLEIRENTVELLQFEGYEVISAINGHEGYQKASQFMPDLILCDLLMPDTDGLKCYQLIKDHPVLKSVPILFFSADSLSSTKHLPKDVSYLRKPFTSDELLGQIQSTFNNFNLIVE